jgi:hypothetical protein
MYVYGRASVNHYVIRDVKIRRKRFGKLNNVCLRTHVRKHPYVKCQCCSEQIEVQGTKRSQPHLHLPPGLTSNVFEWVTKICLFTDARP